MTTYDNAPPQSDWIPPRESNLCGGGCHATANLCWVLGMLDDSRCCDSCSHRPQTWDGDQA